MSVHSEEPAVPKAHPPKAWIPGKNKEDERLSTLKLLLNKITKEKFLPLSLEIRNLLEGPIATNPIVQEYAKAIIEKALREPGYAPLYAQLCKFLCDERPFFKPGLLSECRRTFQKLLQSETQVGNRRLLGCVQYLGEMYNINLIPSKILFCDVARRLWNDGNPREIRLEGICLLFTRTGEKLDAHPTTKKNLDMYLDRMSGIVHDSTFSSRIRFLIMDVLDLRKKSWRG